MPFEKGIFCQNRFMVKALVKIWIVASITGCTLTMASGQDLRQIYAIAPARFVISKSDLDHGRKQVEKVLQDRPGMGKYIAREDTVYRWLVEQFAGEGIGERIYWSNETPTHGAAGQNHPPENGGAAKVLVRKQDLNMKEVECAALIYELLNIRNGREFNKLFRRFLTAKPVKPNPQLREEFVLRASMLEYNTLVSTKSFYSLVWLPSLKARHIESDSWSWRTTIPSSFSEWRKSDDAKTFLKYWGEAYDNWLASKKG